MSKKLATKQKLKHKINVGGVLVSIKNFEDAMMVELHEDSTFVQDVVLQAVVDDCRLGLAFERIGLACRLALA